MGKELHWGSLLLSKRFSRRRVLQGCAVGGLGFAAAFVLGCEESQKAEPPANVNSSGYVPADTGKAESVSAWERSDPKTIIQTIVYMRQKAQGAQNKEVLQRVQKLEEYYKGGVIQLKEQLGSEGKKVADLELIAGSPTENLSYGNIVISEMSLLDPKLSVADLALHLYQISLAYEKSLNRRRNGLGLSWDEIEEIKATAWLQTRDEALPIFGPDAKSPIFSSAYQDFLDLVGRTSRPSEIR